MPAAPDPADPEGRASSRPTTWHRVLLALPRIKGSEEKEPLGDRLRRAVLKPADPAATRARGPSEKPVPVEELEVAAKSANDKERLIGLIAAPFAAAIGVLVTGTLIDNDPPVLRNGHLNKLHVNVSVYHD
ncbi:MAG: hypothetical protein ACRDV4_08650, partial [Acidimicrobiales bacterium]